MRVITIKTSKYFKNARGLSPFLSGGHRFSKDLRAFEMFPVRYLYLIRKSLDITQLFYKNTLKPVDMTK